MYYCLEAYKSVYDFLQANKCIQMLAGLQVYKTFCRPTTVYMIDCRPTRVYMIYCRPTRVCTNAYRSTRESTMFCRPTTVHDSLQAYKGVYDCYCFQANKSICLHEGLHECAWLLAGLLECVWLLAGQQVFFLISLQAYKSVYYCMLAYKSVWLLAGTQ